MNAYGSTILLEAVVSTPCCSKVAEIYDWYIFEGNNTTKLGILIKEEWIRFYEKNKSHSSLIEYIIAPCSLYNFSLKYADSIKPVIDLGFVPICIFDYRSLTNSKLRENAIMILSSLRKHSFAYFPDNFTLDEGDEEILPPGVEFRDESNLRIILYLNIEYNSRILNNPTLKRFLNDYLFGRGKDDG